MARTLRPITQKDYIVTIAGTAARFAKCEGGEEEYDTGEYVDPNDRRKKTTRGALMVSNLTLTKPFNPLDPDDVALIDVWQGFRDNGEPEDLTVVVQPVKADLEATPIGRPRTYYGCQIIRFMRPEVDMDSADPAMVELEIAVDYVDEA